MATTKNPRSNRHGFRRVPDAIKAHIENLEEGSFYVGRRWQLSTSESAPETLVRAGVEFTNGKLDLPKSGVPEGTTRWAKWNRRGRILIHRDLPKIPRSWDMTTPNFGDGAKYGYSTHTRTVEAYPRTRIHGKGFAFVWESHVVDNDIVVTVRVDTVFDGSTTMNSPDLLMALSLIGETFGGPSVFSTSQTTAKWLAAQTVTWEFLPVGESESLPSFDQVASRVKMSDTASVRDTYRERYNAVTSLKPKGILSGTTGFLRYVAFDFGELKVLENFTYGNAIYVMRGDWEELSQLTRPELRNSTDADFDRIEHRKGWQEKLAKAVGR